MILNKDERRSRFQRRKAKRRDDQNHSKCGHIAGNPRYNGEGSDGVKPHTEQYNRQSARVLLARAASMLTS